MDEIVDYLQAQGVDGVLVAQEGQLDVSALLAAGWTVEEEVVVMHGKRIRTLRAPDV